MFYLCLMCQQSISQIASQRRILYRATSKRCALVASVNRFTILEIEDINTSGSELEDIFLLFTSTVNTFVQRPKQKKQLPKELSTNAFNAYRMSLVLIVELSMTNNSQLYFINVLLDCRTTGSFMNYDFVHFKKINTQTILYPILVFNVNSFSNKAG